MLIKDNQTDKEGQLVYLYATDKEEQYSFVEAARAKGYSVLLFDGQLDVPTVSMFEQKFEKSRFTRVDADVIDRLILKEDAKKEELPLAERDNLSAAFKSQLPPMDKADFFVEVKALGEQASPVVITQSEYMRRMKDMSRDQPGMSFYAQMPDSYQLMLNSDHPLIKRVLDDETTQCAEKLKPIDSEIKGLEARLAVLRQEEEKKKPEEITQAEKDDKTKTQSDIDHQKDLRRQVIADYAKGNNIIHQLIDLALLQNGMLKGAALDAFLKRSVELIK